MHRNPRKTVSAAWVSLAALVAGCAGWGVPAAQGAEGAVREEAPKDAEDGDDAVILRLAAPARPGPHSHHSTLVYWGGFHPKTMSYEPLIRHGSGGEWIPALAESWTQSADGTVWTFRLRPGIVAHNGEPFRAADVRDHLLRWRGNPGNRWLGSTDRIADVRALDDRTVELRLTEPWMFPGDAAAVNPGFVMADGAFDYEGTFRTPVGTGPFHLVEHEPGKSFHFEAHESWWGGRPAIDRVEVTVLNTGRESDEAVNLLLAGRVDLIADGESVSIPRESLPRLEKRGFKVWRNPGSSTHYLLLNTRQSPFGDREARRRLAAAIDRNALVRDGEGGYADPSSTLFRAGFGGWPATGAPAPPANSTGTPIRARLLLSPASSARQERLADLLRMQAARAAVDLVLDMPATTGEFDDRVKAGDWDVLLLVTHGMPYDPWISLQILFLNSGDLSPRTASRRPPIWEDDRMRTLVRAALGAVGDSARAAALAEVQRLLGEEVSVIPLFINHRIAVSVPALEGLEFSTDAYDLGLGKARLRR